MNIENKHTEEFREIAKRIPDNYTSIIIGGLVVFIGILILLGIVIEVPETVIAEVRVTSTQPPTILKAQSSGKIKLLVNHFPEACKQGEYLAVIENAADYKHVYQLKQILDTINIRNANLNDSILAYHSLFLGDIEMPFYDFKEALHQYKLLHSEAHNYKHQVSLLQQEISSNIIALKNQKRILQLNRQFHKVKEKQYATDSLLYTKDAILERELDNSYTGLLTSHQQLASTNSSIENMEQAIIHSKIKIINLEEEYENAINEAKLQLNKTYHNLLYNIKKWENTFVFMTPRDGTVELANIISDATYVTVGDAIFNIVYAQNSYYGIAVLPADGAGDVAVGESVNLKMDLYPYQEYGVLEGIVSSISLNSIEKNYLVYINIPNGLISASKKELTFAETMYGTAEIITKKKRLIALIFRKVSDLFSVDKKTSTSQEVPAQTEKNKDKKDYSIQF